MKITKAKLHIALLIVIVIGLGMFTINQFFGWYYKLDLLANPCDQCLKYNEHYKYCFEEQSTYRYIVSFDNQSNVLWNESKKIKINESLLR